MNIASAMDTGSRIKLERQKRSWTQEQLAERAKLATRTVQRVENGFDVSPQTLLLIAEAFGIPAENLCAGTVRVHFGAPMSSSVKVATWACLLLTAALLILGMFDRSNILFFVNMIAIFTILTCLCYSVSGYSVKNGTLFIHRGGWSKRFDLSLLSGLEINAYAMTGSVRLFGNGGLFAFVGWYSNGILGRFRAYATNPKNAVVLEFGSKKIVVTPDDPQAFAEAVREAAKGVCADAESRA